MLTKVRQRLTQETRAGGRPTDPAWANPRLLLRTGEMLSNRGRARLSQAFDLDNPTVKEQLRVLPHTGSLQDAAAKACSGNSSNRCPARNEQSLANHLPLVEGNRRPHRLRRINGEGRGQQHLQQVRETRGQRILQ
jgi:hypothetical protein